MGFMTRSEQWSLWILSQRPWLRHGSWLTRVCLTLVNSCLHWHLKFDVGSFPLTFHALPLHGKRGSRPFVHLLTSSYWESSSNWDFHELWWAWIILSTSSEKFWLESQTWLLTHTDLFDIYWHFTSEASLWHSMLCPLTASVARGPSYIFLHLLTENHLPTGTFMNFDELSSFCQPRLKTTWRYSAKSVRLGGYDLIQTGPIRWLHHELNATGHAGQLSASVIAFFGPLDSFAEALT